MVPAGIWTEVSLAAGEGALCLFPDFLVRQSCLFTGLGGKFHHLADKSAELQVFLSDQALQFLQQTIQLCTGPRLLRAGPLHLCTVFWGADAQITQELQGGPQGWLQIIWASRAAASS